MKCEADVQAAVAVLANRGDARLQSGPEVGLEPWLRLAGVLGATLWSPGSGTAAQVHLATCVGGVCRIGAI
jgi:hypothetical protein